MRKSFSLKFGAALLAAALLANGGAAMAEDAVSHNTPRVDQVEKRVDEQNKRVNDGVAKGTITPAQAARDNKRDEAVTQKLGKDEAKHHGHITKREQRRLNKKLDKNSAVITKQKSE